MGSSVSNGPAATVAMVVAIAVAASFLGGCGDDDDASNDATGATATTSAAQAAPALRPLTDRQALERDLEGWRSRHDLPGALLGVQRGTEPPVIVSAGPADAPRPALGPDSVVPVASLTKTFVAAVALQLVGEGALDLDAQISEYVEWPDGARITVRQLMNHTSGLPSLNNADQRAEWQPRILADLTRVWTADEALGYVRGQPLRFDPGTDFHYSNANFILLGVILERVTGTPIAQLIDDRITTPLRLADTRLDDGAGPIPDRVPHLFFDLAGDGTFVDVRDYPRRAVITLYGASGGMLSSASDLLSWSHALYGTDGVLSDSERVEMTTLGRRGSGLGTFGACPCAGTGEGLRFAGVGHDGDFPGFRTAFAYFERADVAVVVATNQTPTEYAVLEELIEHVMTSGT